MIDWDNFFGWVADLYLMVFMKIGLIRRFFTSENKININHNIIKVQSIQSGLTILGDDGHLLSGDMILWKMYMA